MTTNDSTGYDKFINLKLTVVPPTGITSALDLPASLFPFQRDLVSWACRRGRAALFADTGLGKTAMSLSWAREVVRATGRDVLVLAPLAVAAQTAAEGARLGINVTICRDGADVLPGINVANYERLHRFDVSRFAGVLVSTS